MDACRKHDIIPFFYYASLEWWHPDKENNFENIEKIQVEKNPDKEKQDENGNPTKYFETQGTVKDVEGIGICELTSHDVVRHPMVQKILECYEKYENE